MQLRIPQYENFSMDALSGIAHLRLGAVVLTLYDCFFFRTDEFSYLHLRCDSLRVQGLETFVVHGVNNIVTSSPEATLFNIPIRNVEHIFFNGSMATIQTRQSLARLLCCECNSFIFSGFDRLWLTSFDKVSIRRVE